MNNETLRALAYDLYLLVALPLCFYLYPRVRHTNRFWRLFVLYVLAYVSLIALIIDRAVSQIAR